MDVLLIALLVALPVLVAHWGVDSRRIDDPRVVAEVKAIAVRRGPETVAANRWFSRPATRKTSASSWDALDSSGSADSIGGADRGPFGVPTVWGAAHAIGGKSPRE
jgi:hypothetical protein